MAWWFTDLHIGVDQQCQATESWEEPKGNQYDLSNSLRMMINSEDQTQVLKTYSLFSTHIAGCFHLQTKFQIPMACIIAYVPYHSVPDDLDSHASPLVYVCMCTSILICVYVVVCVLVSD